MKSEEEEKEGEVKGKVDGWDGAWRTGLSEEDAKQRLMEKQVSFVLKDNYCIVEKS